MNDGVSEYDREREGERDVAGGRADISHSLARRACIGSETEYELVPPQMATCVRVRFRYVGFGQPLPYRLDSAK